MKSLDSRHTERLVVFTLLLITAGLSLSAYPHLAARLTGRGVEVTWLRQLGLGALAALLGLVGVLTCGLALVAVAWCVDGGSRVLRYLLGWR